MAMLAVSSAVRSSLYLLRVEKAGSPGTGGVSGEASWAGELTLLHHLQVHIRLLIASGLESIPNLLAVEKPGMDEHRSQGGKGQSIVECKSWREEKRGVVGILFDIKGMIAVNDTTNIVCALSVVIGLGGHQGQILGVHGARIGDSDGRENHKYE
jgi:hypothetical protein